MEMQLVSYSDVRCCGSAIPKILFVLLNDLAYSVNRILFDKSHVLTLLRNVSIQIPDLVALIIFLKINYFNLFEFCLMK